MIIARRIAAAWGLALVLLLGVAGGATPAHGHAALVQTEPAAGSTLTTAPAAVVLRFNEPIDLPPLAVLVLDRDARRVDQGTPDRADGDGRTARIELTGVDPGIFVVAWQVVSADAHPIRGAFTFRYDPTGAPPTAAELDEAAIIALEARARAGAERAVRLLAGLSRFAVFTGLMVLVGGAALVLVLWPAGLAAPTAARIIWGGWAAALLGSLGVTVLHGPMTIAGGLTDALDPALLQATLGTRSGTVWAVRILLLLLAVPTLATARARPVESLPRWWWSVATGIGVGLVLTPGLSGHAVTGPLVPLAVLADGAHVGAAAVWLGGLTVLVAAALREAPVEAQRALVVRFSTLATGCLAIVVATGTFQAWRQVGSLDGLTGTTYGRTLLVKLAVFAGILVLAWLNNRRVRRELEGAEPSLAWRSATAVGADVALAHRPILGRIRHAAGVEVALAVVVLAVTASLVNAAPARTEAALPVEATLRSDQVVLDVIVLPARRGVNEVHFYAFEPGGAPLFIDGITATVTLPAQAVGPLDVPVAPLALGPGHYVARAAEIPLAGEWLLEVAVRLNPVEVVRLTATIPVRS